jgi:hypothetical protein
MLRSARAARQAINGVASDTQDSQKGWVTMGCSPIETERGPIVLPWADTNEWKPLLSFKPSAKTWKKVQGKPL